MPFNIDIPNSEPHSDHLGPLRTLLDHLHHFGPLFVARAQVLFRERTVTQAQRLRLVETTRIIGGAAIRINARGTRALNREPNGQRITDWHAAISIAAVRYHLENDLGYTLVKGYPAGIHRYRSPEQKRPNMEIGVVIVPRTLTPTKLSSVINRTLNSEVLALEWLEVWASKGALPLYTNLPTIVANNVITQDLQQIPDALPVDRSVTYL